MATTITPATRHWTYADLEAMPEREDGSRYEIYEEELVASASPVPFHQSLSLEFTLEFGGHVKAGRLGRVSTAPIDVKLDEDVVFVPDLVFVARDRLGIVGPTTIEGPPDLIVKILSPSTKRRDRRDKLRLYARFGVREYWIVDPEARTVVGHVLGNGRYDILPPEEGRLRSLVLPDLAIEVEAVFAAAEA